MFVLRVSIGGVKGATRVTFVEGRLRKQEQSYRVRIRNHLIAQYFPELDRDYERLGAEGLSVVRWCLDSFADHRIGCGTLCTTGDISADHPGEETTFGGNLGEGGRVDRLRWSARTGL